MRVQPVLLVAALLVTACTSEAFESESEQDSASESGDIAAPTPSGEQSVPSAPPRDVSPGPDGSPGPMVGSVEVVATDAYLLADPPIEPTTEQTPSSADEPSGNFRFGCAVSHLAYDDPIVFPGDPGASHLHMYFGNTAADADSDYESLRSTGESTCQGGRLNRSAYWMPAVLDGDGRVVAPSWVIVYYKGPGVTADGELLDVAAFPPGMRMIAGRRVEDVASPSPHRWQCDGDDRSDLVTIPSCEPGEAVIVSLPFPSCWDGVHLDAADHRSHTAYVQYDEETGQPSCPESHPVPIPEFTLNVGFNDADDSGEWRLSSDGEQGDGAASGHAGREAPPVVHEAGSSFHSDWFGAWDLEIQQTWIDECINGLLNCSYGDLGDGTRLSPIEDPTDPPQRLVPPSPPR